MIAGPILLATLAALRLAGPLSPRTVRYEVVAKIDDAASEVIGHERLTWTNPTDWPTPEIVLELPRDGAITALRIDGDDRIAQLRSDGGIARIPLLHPLPAHASATLELDFRYPIPPRDELIALTEWLPRVAVFDCRPPPLSPCAAVAAAPDCHFRLRAHRPSEESLTELGLFDVQLDVPARLRWGASGVLAAERVDKERRILTLHAEDVADFAFVGHPHFTEHAEALIDAWGKVSIRLLALPGHERTVPRHLRAIREGLPEYERRFGPYPYSQLTVIDLEDGGGLEFPTLLFTSESWLPEGFHGPEYLTLHELAHQWFYGIIATDQTDDPWLDEGLAVAATDGALATMFGADRGMVDLFGLHASLGERVRIEYRRFPNAASILTASAAPISPEARHATVYAKSDLALHTAGALFGDAAVEASLHRYAAQGRFAHPDPTRFVCAFPEETQRFWRGVLAETRTLDDEVMEVSGTTVVVRHNGDLRLPLKLRAQFVDGTGSEVIWDGDGAQHRFEFSPRTVQEAEVDPERKELLDLVRWNDGKRAAGDGRPRERVRSLEQGIVSALLSLVGP